MTLASTENWNSTTPAPPSGQQNIVFANDGGTPLVKFSASDPPMVGDAGSGGTGGNVPAPPSGSAAAGKFLKADGTWEIPAGSFSNPMTTEGDIIYGGASGAATRLAAGTAGELLQTNGSSAAPSWVAAPTSAMTRIAQTQLASPAASVTFSSIPGTYSSLLIVASGLASDNNNPDYVALQFNGDTGNGHYEFSGFWGGNTAGNVNNSGSTSLQIAQIMNSAINNYGGSLDCIINNASSASRYRSVQSRFYGGSTGNCGTFGGNWNSTAQITSIELLIPGGGNFPVGAIFTLYGLA